MPQCPRSPPRRDHCRCHSRYRKSPRRANMQARFEISEAFDVGRPLDKNRQIAGTTRIEAGIAGMIDGGDDKTGIGERLGRIVVVGEGTGHAVRDDDERQR
jgi:hypothetical protein